MKVTLLMAVALRTKDCTIVPYCALELPMKKSGHPYMTDMLVTKIPDTTSSDEGSIAAVLKNETILMIIECKKAVSLSFLMIDHSDVIEMLIYCQYLLEIYKQAEITGIMTDSINWHCIYIKKGDPYMKIYKYVCFGSKKEEQIIGMLPKLL